MNTYTQTKISELCALVDVLRDNINHYAVKFKVGETSWPFPDWSVYTCEEILTMIVSFISDKPHRAMVRSAIEDWPLEDMPLMINETDGRQIIALWRLKIAK